MITETILNVSIILLFICLIYSDVFDELIVIIVLIIKMNQFKQVITICLATLLLSDSLAELSPPKIEKINLNSNWSL
jgi:hypothetical protein